MERLLFDELRVWKDSPYRKPLVLEGARQVGKTWLLEEFGKREFKNCVCINFVEEPEFVELFESTKDPHRLMPQLALAKGQPINGGTTLLILDEIQKCHAALNSLKFFQLKMPELHIACAGSLLGVAQTGSVPVGYVDYLNLYPLTFSEFLAAGGSDNLPQVLESINQIEPLPQLFATPLVEQLKIYFTTGGMPEVVNRWIHTGDPLQIARVQRDILTSYRKDFPKHIPKQLVPKVRLIFDSLPSQLGRENKKFLYQLAKPGARAREYENALKWLEDAGLLYKIFRTNSPRSIPLSAYDDLSSFKTYMLDVGLLGRMAGLDSTAIIDEAKLLTQFKGALAENFVLQSLVPMCEVKPRYWTSDSGQAEVDFIIQYRNEIIPIEVKASKNIQSKSLTEYSKRFAETTPLRVRFSLRNLTLDGNLLNVPLYCADHALRIIDLALERTEVR